MFVLSEFYPSSITDWLRYKSLPSIRTSISKKKVKYHIVTLREARHLNIARNIPLYILFSNTIVSTLLLSGLGSRTWPLTKALMVSRCASEDFQPEQEVFVLVNSA